MFRKAEIASGQGTRKKWSDIDAGLAEACNSRLSLIITEKTLTKEVREKALKTEKQR